MTLDILVIERERPDDFDVYRDAIRRALLDARVHCAQTEEEALRFSRSVQVIGGKAHDIPAAAIHSAPKLGFIQAFTTGIDHLRAVGLPAGVAVANARGIHGPQMAELAILHMIALVRDYPRMRQNQQAKVWQRWPQRLLFGKTAVLLGVGSISEAIATRLSALGMCAIGVSSGRSEAPGFERVVPREKLTEIVREADFLVVLVPLTRDTRHIVDAQVLNAMPPHAYLINLARGPCVDEAALITALQNGDIAGAGLDVFEEEPPSPENPLWTMPNVTMTPRIGGMSDMYAHQVAPVFVENLRRFAANGPVGLVNSVEL